MTKLKRLAFNIIRAISDLLMFFPFLILSIISRFIKKRIDVGLGPDPLINNIYHKKALELSGFKAETFVRSVFHITKDFDRFFIYKNKFIKYSLVNILHIDFIYAIFSYKCLYIYFNGGPLSNSFFLWKTEHLFYKISNIKVVVMPYGADIQVLDETPNLYFRHCMNSDYPQHKSQYSIMKSRKEIWQTYADFIIGGCDWVDYLYHWDKLMVAHFSIDTSSVIETSKRSKKKKLKKTFRILHAPNHYGIKGTSHIIQAIDQLKSEGLNIDFSLVENVSNDEVIKHISETDLVIDQLVIGWYAMFSIEAMTLGKPVICFLREDLLELYHSAGLIKKNEPPIINANPNNIKEIIRQCVKGKIKIKGFADRGYQYVKKIHSIEAIGKEFYNINKQIGIFPRRK